MDANISTGEASFGATRRRWRLQNRSVSQKPGAVPLQHVVTMAGREICAVRADAPLDDVKDTVLRILDLGGCLTEAIQLIPVDGAPLASSASHSSSRVLQAVLNPTAMFIGGNLYQDDDSRCDFCFGRYGVPCEGGWLLEGDEACKLCLPSGCCSKCSHKWRLSPINNDQGTTTRTGTPICALCVTQSMLDTEAAEFTLHFKLVALAYLGDEPMLEAQTDTGVSSHPPW